MSHADQIRSHAREVYRKAVGAAGRRKPIDQAGVVSCLGVLKLSPDQLQADIDQHLENLRLTGEATKLENQAAALGSQIQQNSAKLAPLVKAELTMRQKICKALDRVLAGDNAGHSDAERCKLDRMELLDEIAEQRRELYAPEQRREELRRQAAQLRANVRPLTLRGEELIAVPNTPVKIDPDEPRIADAADPLRYFDTGLETAFLLSQQEVPVRQIAQMLNLLDKGGKLSTVMAEQETFCPGWHVGKPGWKDPQTPVPAAVAAKAKPKREAKGAQYAEAREPECPESLRELIEQDIDDRQIAQMKRCSQAEIDAERTAMQEEIAGSKKSRRKAALEAAMGA